jgi:hypothetical protein
MKRILLSVLLCAIAAFGADFSGRWSGTAESRREDGSTGTDGVYFDLKQEGTAVTGTGGGPEDVLPINNGKVDGNTVTFEVAPEGRGVFKVTLTMNGDSMTGHVSREGEGGMPVAKLSLKREK